MEGKSLAIHGRKVLGHKWEKSHGNYIGWNSWAIHGREIHGREVMGNTWESCYGKFVREKLWAIHSREVMENT